MVQLNFNAANTKPSAGYEPLPSGLYAVTITSSEEKPTKDGQGSYIQLDMTVQGGEHNGKKVTDRLNIVNRNQQAVDIAYSTLSAICHVTGRMQIQDTQQLHGVPFQVLVAKVKRTDGEHANNPDSYSNEIKGYKDINGNDPGYSGSQNTTGQQGGGNGQGSGAPAWAGNGQGGQQGGQQPQQGQGGQQTQVNPIDPNQGQAWAGNGQGSQPQNQQPQQPQNNGNQNGGGQGNQAPQNGGSNQPPWVR